MKPGDRISVRKVNGTIREVYETESCVVLMDDGTTWFSPQQYAPEILTAFPQIEEPIPYAPTPGEELPDDENAGASNPPEEVPAEIPERFLIHLRDHQSEVDIRMGFPPKAEAATRDLFVKLGLSMPEQIRPFNIGARGSQKEGKRGLGLEVTFPAPADLSIVPLRYRTTADGQLRICNTRFGLGLLVLGFLVTNYTKEKQVSLA